MFDPGRMTSVRRADIESMEPPTVSMMPEGLLNSLKADEIADLLAYLVSRGDAEHALYRVAVSLTEGGPDDGKPARP